MLTQIHRALAALAAFGIVAAVVYAAIVLAQLARKPDHDTTYVYVKSYAPQDMNRTAKGTGQHR